MADLTTSTKISESSREVIYAFQYQYVDTGNESAVLKIDVSGLTADADGNACTGIRIAECWWIIKAMTVQVLADADTDIIIMHLPSDFTDNIDMSDFGGLSSSLGTSPNGDILFTTTGAGAAGDSYNVVLKMIKDY